MKYLIIRINKETFMKSENIAKALIREYNRQAIDYELMGEVFLDSPRETPISSL